MLDPLNFAKRLHRPQLLVASARHALNGYARKRHLPRLLQQAELPEAGEATMRLIDLEKELEHARRRKDAAYDAVRHVEMLTAIMHEARMLAWRKPSDQANASATSSLCLVT